MRSDGVAVTRRSCTARARERPLHREHRSLPPARGRPGSSPSRSTGPKPCIPPRSCTAVHRPSSASAHDGLTATGASRRTAAARALLDRAPRVLVVLEPRCRAPAPRSSSSVPVSREPRGAYAAVARRRARQPCWSARPTSGARWRLPHRRAPRREVLPPLVPRATVTSPVSSPSSASGIRSSSSFTRTGMYLAQPATGR